MRITSYYGFACNSSLLMKLSIYLSNDSAITKQCEKINKCLLLFTRLMIKKLLSKVDIVNSNSYYLKLLKKNTDVERVCKFNGANDESMSSVPVKRKFK